MSETAPYTARKTEGQETWEIYNSELKEVSEAGLTEEVAKGRAEIANRMYAEATSEGAE